MNMVRRSGLALICVGLLSAPAWGQQNPAMQNPGVVEPKSGTAKSEQPPLPGANSFAEGQARKLLEARGFTDVSPLVNDSQGIWRGTAKSGTNKVQVSVDFRGNVTANPQ